ncbi:hypothetical protein AC788_18755 [Pseudomonas sp. RIT-PI-a]|nr:hypothetical protein AC788_18755 [Pseudomonas sp. RIT-PI-a]
MVATGKHRKHIIVVEVDQPVLLVDAPRPVSGEVTFQWFGATYSLEGITQDMGNEVIDSFMFTGVILGPVLIVSPTIGSE